MIKNIKWLALAAIIATACTKKDDEVVVNPDSSNGLALTAGTADFSRYVALGNSLSAGFSDNALFIEGQKGSWTSLLSQKFALVGGGAFKIPLMSDNVGGILGVPGFNPRLIWNGSAPTSVGLPPYSQVPTTQLLPALTGPFNNMGVPGAKSFHLIAPGYGNVAGLVPNPPTANPYFVRFASTPNATILADAMAQQPTFFSLWIGNNDVLGYALSGGDGTNPITPSAGAVGVGFDATYNFIVNTLTTNPITKGVIANIPYVNTIPQFTTVPFNPLTPSVLGGGSIPTGDATIGALNTNLYGPLKQVLTAIEASGAPGTAGAGSRINLLTPSSASNPNPSNPLLMKDEYLVNFGAQITAALTPTLGAAVAGAFGAIYGQARQTNAMDYVPLTSRGEIGATEALAPASINRKGISFPFEDKLVLSKNEVMELKTATDAYNATILSIATAKGLAFVDANSLLSKVATPSGIISNGVAIKSNYVSGGAFSLDGVHPTPRGYALIANSFMAAINAKYGSNLKDFDLATFRTLFPPTL